MSPAITRYPVKAEIHAPNKAAYQFTGAAAFTALTASNKPAPAMAGVASSIENLAAAARVIPSPRAIDIVIPDREIPGSTDNI